MKRPNCYERFLETKQEPVRLAAALEGFFSGEARAGEREDYARYLRRRIRPAMASLIEEDDVGRMETFEELGWLDGVPVEEFLRTAREKKKMASLVWLLRLKDEKVGFSDRDFTL